jgi:hypothetical protein
VPELVPDVRDDADSFGGECQALALALVAARSPDEGPFPLFRIVTRPATRAGLPPTDLARLARKLQNTDATEPWTIATDPAGRLHVELVPAGAGRSASDEDKDINK